MADGGSIAGAIIGVLIFVAVCAGVYWFFWGRHGSGCIDCSGAGSMGMAGESSVGTKKYANVADTTQPQAVYIAAGMHPGQPPMVMAGQPGMVVVTQPGQPMM